MAMKRPCTSSIRVWRVFKFLTRTPATSSSPKTSSTALSQMNRIFGLEEARSCMVLLALRESRRWITVTSEANLVRNVLSSMAVSPPPTTATFLFLKKKASQVAQAETPWPMSFFSDGSPSHCALAPVAMITLSARARTPSVVSSRKGLLPKSALQTFSGIISTPSRRHCLFMRSMSSGPRMGASKPG